MPAEVDVDDWTKRLETSVTVLFHAHRELLEAVGDAIYPATETAEAVRDRARKANEALDGFSRAVADRRRAVATQRVCRAA